MDIDHCIHNEAFNLSKEAQNQLLTKLQDTYDLYLQNFDERRKPIPIKVFYGGYMDALLEYKKSLRLANIYIAWNWVGHRNEVFFVTEEDIENQMDWMEQCRD